MASSPEVDTLLSVIEDEPTILSINGVEVRAFVGAATLTDEEDGARLERRAVIVSGDQPTDPSVAAMGSRSYTVESVIDYGGAWEGELVSEG